MTYIERIYDASTGEITEREYTSDEIAEMKSNEAKAAEFTKELEVKAAQKSALLAKLGITEDEAKLLLS
jgi:hypothetical protein